MYKFLLIFLASLSFASIVDAANYRINGSDLIMSGRIERNELTHFNSIINRHTQINRVILRESHGGNYLAGIAISKSIRKNGLATYIPAGVRCISACTDIFIGGVIRDVHYNAKFGVHIASNAIYYSNKFGGRYISQGELRRIIEKSESGTHWSTVNDMYHYLSMGVSLRYMKYVSKFVGNNISWLSYHQLKDFNIVNVD